MNSLSEHAKKELVDALQGKESGVFVINGKLFSIEVENDNEEIIEDLSGNLAKEIEEYPELKASLSRYKDNPDMKRYSGSELKSKRNEKRK
ncbi:hypothetical protein RCG17_23545 [Neobacillus sp. PS3-12]|uniref:hypothetical protein n=1 Tax=Neobacillus sp. PS3-12 TaxID=3070677 RepID=UPI0027DF9966|nr:hypothetical protein [Neobacillus sp. PS3-12]WML52277.1 hypothetical protein RCG17_23290 [Neobacillus sp. PS3-12]WML52322.1 hypothetical protein RCG17_23545 [Neobacillus sp. PS3-12]